MSPKINIKSNRKLLISLLVLLSVFIVCILFIMITNLIVVFTTSSRTYSVDEAIAANLDDDYDAIIVLGCGVYSDGTPTPLLSDRLDAAIALYNAGLAPKILMSGDHYYDNYNEVASMRNYAIQRGVPSDDIFMDHAGLSTYETMARASNIFQIDKAIVVTQEYHLYRSLYLANSMGIDAVGVIATGHIFKSQPYYSFREVLARTKDFTMCIFKPDLYIDGDVIDITGSGEVTLDEP